MHSQKRSRVACFATVNHPSNSNRQPTATFLTMEVPSLRYMTLLQRLRPHLQQLPPEETQEPLHQKTHHHPPLWRRRRVFIARLPQLILCDMWHLIEAPADVSRYSTGGRSGLLHVSLQLLDKAAEQHGAQAMVILASLRPVCPVMAHDSPISVTPVVFFLPLPPADATLVSRLTMCEVITPQGDVTAHYAAMELFLIMHTGLFLLDVTHDSTTDKHRRMHIKLARPWAAERCLVLCCVQQRLQRRGRGSTLCIILSDDSISNSRVIHRSWEHDQPPPVLIAGNLHWRCIECGINEYVTNAVCRGCKQRVSDMRSFCVVLTWKGYNGE